MTTTGRLPHSIMFTTPGVLEAMAERSGHPIEIHDDRAYLTAGGVTWWAILPPAGQVSA